MPSGLPVTAGTLLASARRCGRGRVCLQRSLCGTSFLPAVCRFASHGSTSNREDRRGRKSARRRADRAPDDRVPRISTCRRFPTTAALLKIEVAGICGTDVKFYAKPPIDDPVIMGHENIGIIAKAGKTFKKRRGLKEGDLVFVEHYVGCMNCEHCHRGDYRLCMATDWRKNPDGIRFGYTLGRTRAAPLGRLRAVHVPAVERGPPQGAGRAVAGTRRRRHADGQRHPVGAVRLRRRLRQPRAGPGAGPAGPEPGGRLQAGGRLADHRHRHREGHASAWRWRRSSAPTTSSTSTRKTRWSGSREITGGEGVDVALDCTAGAGTIPMLLGIEALKRKGGTLLIQGEELAEFPNFPLRQDRQQVHHREGGARPQLRILRAGAAAADLRPLPARPDHHPPLRAEGRTTRIKAVGGSGEVIHVSLMPWM